MAIERIKILGVILELPAKQHCQNSPFGPFVVNGLDWQCCLDGSSKMAPRILIFSIAMGADCSFYVKSIATYAPAFFAYNSSVLASVCYLLPKCYESCLSFSFFDTTLTLIINCSKSGLIKNYTTSVVSFHSKQRKK